MEKIITALEPQKNNPGRINVYIDSQFAFGISKFVGIWLSKGEKLDDDKIQQLLEKDTYEKALQTALRFIDYHPRTEREVRQRLIKSGFEDLTIEHIVQELIGKDYINDQRYAQEWIESRSSTKPRSQNFFSYELKRKGVSEEDIVQAINGAPSDHELALNLGSKYLNRFQLLQENDFRKKMHGILARRAFRYEIIKDTIERLIEIRKSGKNEEIEI